MLFACGGKRITSDFIEYEGSLDGNYRASAVMVDKFNDVKACMSIWDAFNGRIDFPPMDMPTLRVMGCEMFEDCDVNAVVCPEIAKPTRGCYLASGIVMLPANVKPGIIDHEFVHHICNQTGICPNDVHPLDPLHTSIYFLKCSGLKTE